MPIAANLIASENRERISPLIDADTLGDFLRRSRRFGTSISFPDYVQAIFRDRVRHFEKSCDKIAQPDWLTLVAIRSDERKKSQERAHLANAREFNRRYLTCQISAILYADCGDRQKSQCCTGHTWRFSSIAAIGENRQVCRRLKLTESQKGRRPKP